MLTIFDVQPVGSEPGAEAGVTRRYVGSSDGGRRQMVDGSQILAQALVAAAKCLPAKTIRSAHAVFSRTVAADQPIELDVEVVHEGRSFATAVVTAGQGARRCVQVTVLLDTPTADVIRHHALLPTAVGPDDALACVMPMVGRDLRIVGFHDPNDPAEVGPPVIDAWVRYDPVPSRPDLAAALLAHFTGHLSISTAMRPHDGVGTAMAHDSVSTGVLAIGVTFHEPTSWDDWLLYHHESTQAGAGMAHGRGQVFTGDGRLVASFYQDAMIRPFVADAVIDRPVEERL